MSPLFLFVIQKVIFGGTAAKRVALTWRIEEEEEKKFSNSRERTYTFFKEEDCISLFEEIICIVKERKKKKDESTKQFEDEWGVRDGGGLG